MIDYFKGLYGLNLLGRVHGSSLYKGSLMGFLAVFVYLAIVLGWNHNGRNTGDYGGNDLDSPYAIGVLVSSVSFLIIFRANYGYQRYWEACTSLSHFMSKWMDATIHTAVFHMQSKHYDEARPPNYFNHDGLNKLNLTRERKRKGKTDDDADLPQRKLKSVVDCEKEFFPEESLVRAPGFIKRALDADASDHDTSPGSNESPRRSRRSYMRPQKPPNSPHRSQRLRPSASEREGDNSRGSSSVSPRRERQFSLPNSVLGGRWNFLPSTPEVASSAMMQRSMLNSKYFPSSLCPNENFACRPDGLTPPLFLQELAHLASLACAVALSTLRNDMEGMESVLDMYIPGAPWPPKDPDRLPRHVRNHFQHRFHPVTIIRHWMGNDRLPKWRAKYNAARPLLVLGGVSDSEIRYLQRARGAQAKAHLALGWLKEFIVREHLDGSLGEVHSAIISRLVQFLSDGMLHYHQARKIMYIPFPFPHAQLSAFFTVVMVLAIPFLMDQYTNILWIGSLLTFMTVTCLVGLHEVARELENPFRNVPNELPLCTLQARYNETLVTMFSGFNPDSYWDAELYQGPLEAMKLGKIYQMDETNCGHQLEKSAVMGNILEMPVLAESTGEGSMTESNGSREKSAMKQQQSSQQRGKHVSFSADVETSSDDVARELREILAKQTMEMEELVRLLDDQDGEN